ncbi:MAG: TIGR03960 family B12-binding radical SAM protein [bacterium]
MMTEEKLAAILAKVEKPARYIGTEWNSVHKEHRQMAIKFALAFPDIYEVGMSHLGSKILYHELNRRKDTAGERVFAPWVDMEAAMRREGIPLYALESRVPIREFDFVGFTLQYEMSYTNILNMLDLAGIPLTAASRGLDDPFVLAGGPCAFNVEPLADFFDFVVLGEGEVVIHAVLDEYLAWKNDPERTRAGLLERLARIDGVYVPSFYQLMYNSDGTVRSVAPADGDIPLPVRKRAVADLDTLDYPTKPIVPFLEIVHDRAMLEVFRGCSRGCRFCQAGMIYRPVRERSRARLEEQAQALICQTGYNEISLSSLNTSDYSQVQELVGALVDQHRETGVGVSLPSSRVDSFSVALLEKIQQVRKTGLTLAPEAGTQRLRDVINKNVTEEDFTAAVTDAFQAGWSSLKFYFMLGLPTETEADLDGIAELAKKAISLHREVTRAGSVRRRAPRITVSVASFVPKPHTPFQWEPQMTVEELKERQRYLARALRHGNIVYNWHDAEVSFLEAVFSRGDRRLGAVLVAAWRAGCRFDGWSEHFRYETWLKAFADCGLDPAFYANRRRPYTEILPWEHLDAGVSKDYLMSEHRKALLGQTTTDCRFDRCLDCGVCPGLGVALDVKGGDRGGAL